MSAWDAYIENLVGDGAGCVESAAICGFQAAAESVWAASKDSLLSQITQAEIQQLVAHDRSHLQCKGATLGGVKLAMVNDMFCDESPFIVLKTKDGANASICVAKSKTALVIVKGRPNDPPNNLNLSATKMANYLNESGI